MRHGSAISASSCGTSSVSALARHSDAVPEGCADSPVEQRVAQRDARGAAVRHEAVQVALRQRAQQHRDLRIELAQRVQVQHLVADRDAHAQRAPVVPARRKRPNGRFWIGKSVSGGVGGGDPAGAPRARG